MHISSKTDFKWHLKHLELIFNNFGAIPARFTIFDENSLTALVKLRSWLDTHTSDTDMDALITTQVSTIYYLDASVVSKILFVKFFLQKWIPK